jgi:hypothetical protein
VCGCSTNLDTDRNDDATPIEHTCLEFPDMTRRDPLPTGGGLFDTTLTPWQRLQAAARDRDPDCGGHDRTDVKA